MKTRHSIFLIVCLNLYFKQIQAQRFSDQVPEIRKYTEAELLQGGKGIVIFDRLCSTFEGDSIKYTPDGYNVQGWQEQFYANGKLLHRGFYQDGKLLVFKNYYENGNCERSFLQPDPLNSTLEIFHNSGKTAKHITYYNGLVKKTKEFFENGASKKIEEFENDGNRPVYTKTWFAQGAPESELKLTDAKNNKYQMKKYYENGQLREEGTVVLMNSETVEKTGTWTFYDENGKNKRTEKFNLKLSSN